MPGSLVTCYGKVALYGSRHRGFESLSNAERFAFLSICPFLTDDHLVVEGEVQDPSGSQGTLLIEKQIPNLSWVSFSGIGWN